MAEWRTHSCVMVLQERHMDPLGDKPVFPSESEKYRTVLLRLRRLSKEKQRMPGKLPGNLHLLRSFASPKDDSLSGHEQQQLGNNEDILTAQSLWNHWKTFSLTLQEGLRREEDSLLCVQDSGGHRTSTKGR